MNSSNTPSTDDEIDLQKQLERKEDGSDDVTIGRQFMGSSSGSQKELNGTADDLKRAEYLYAKDREQEAIDILDNILRLPQGIEPGLEYLRDLMKDTDIVKVTLDLVADTDSHHVLKMGHKLAGGYVRSLMILRSKCFTALMDSEARKKYPQLVSRATENAEIILQLFPEDTAFMVLAAQVFFLQRDAERAIVLAEQALKLSPESKYVQSALKMFQHGYDSASFRTLTERALAVIQKTMDEAEPTGNINKEWIKTAADLLMESLDLFERQPKAWAGMAWLLAILNNPEEAVKYLRTAQHYDPSDDLVQTLSAEFNRRGWMGKQPVTRVIAAWMTSGGNVSRTGVSDATVKPPLTLAWSFDDCDWIRGGIVVSGFTAVFGDVSGKTHAIDVRNGRKLWEYKLEGMITGTPATDGTRLFIGGAKCAVCLDMATGKELWQTNPFEVRESSFASMGCVLCMGGLVVYCDERLSLLNAEDGESAGNMDILLEPYGHTGACADQQSLYIPSGRSIHRIALDSGKIDGKLHTNGKVSAGPVISDDILIYGSSRSTVEAVDARTLQSKWSFEIEETPIYEYSGAAVESRPAVTNKRAVFGGPDGNIYCLSQKDGALLWKYSTGGCLESPPLVIGGVAYFLAAKGEFCAISLSEGQCLWKFEADEEISPADCAPAIGGNRVLVGWDKLYAFKSEKVSIPH